jgi:hypothetical protein
MKNIVLVLAVCVLAVPALAAVKIEAVPATNYLGGQCGFGVVAIKYTVTGEKLVSAFALDISVDAGVIEGCGKYKKDGESVPASKGYGISMGNIEIDENGTVVDYSSPVAPPTAPDNPGQLGSSQQITIEMGALYDREDPSAAPPSTGTLCMVNVSESCNLTVTADSTRGGIVYEDGSQSTGADLDLADATNVAVVATCSTCGSNFDINGDTYLGPEDLLALNALLYKYAGQGYYIWEGNEDYNPCLDANCDTFIGPEDLLAFLVYLQSIYDPYWGYYIACTEADFPYP